MSRPDYLNQPESVRKKLTEKPPKNATPEYVQSVIRWAAKPRDKKEPQTAVPLGGLATVPGERNE